MHRRRMSYRVSAPAEADLIGIARYTRRHWGHDRAAAYIDGLFESFQRLSGTLEVGHKRDDLRSGLRVVLHMQHYHICYRIDGDEVQILRVIHTRRDLARQIAVLRGTDRR